MNKATSLFLISTCLTLLSFSVSAEDQGKLKWCENATITGTVQKSTVTHPMNRSKFVVFTLSLKQPVDIAAAECEGSKVAKANTKEVQVKDEQSVLNKYVGKTITVSGLLMFPDNAYDVRPAILYPPITVTTE